ncbi:MAG: hypothetical protein H0V29_00540 [Thermoleophilaceae bacterium]|nr:hypothetical protein [Thermoleophilaceae bacterium]
MKRALLIPAVLLAGCGGAEPTGPPAERIAREYVAEDGDEATIDCEDTTASDCSLSLKRDGGRWKIDGSLSPND